MCIGFERVVSEVGVSKKGKKNEEKINKQLEALLPVNSTFMPILTQAFGWLHKGQRSSGLLFCREDDLNLDNRRDHGRIKNANKLKKRNRKKE